jgi:hypothetical protein
VKKVLSLFATALLAAPAFAADIGVSIGIGDPNFYGNIVIGNAPPPVLVYREPVVIVRSQVVYEPIYLRVRAGHAQNWSQHCGQYNACGRPVYFVQNEYYNDVYAPHYHKHHGKGKGKGNKGNGKGNKG